MVAGVAKLVDALDLGSSEEARGGSSPSTRTMEASASTPQRGVHAPRFMKTEITREDELHRDFIVKLSEAEFNQKVDVRLTELMPGLRVPGFRPGKVPLKVMRQRFAERVHGEVIKKLVDETTQALVQKHELKPAMQPKLEITEFDAKKGLTFTASFVLSGEFTLMDEKKLKPTQYTIKPSKNEVKQSLERLQNDMRTSAPIKRKRKSKMGDVLVIDFVGNIDGQKFDGGSAENHSLELGSGQFIPGFEQQLVGLNAGDEKDVKVSFPKDYSSSELAGKDAVFAVKVKEIHDFVLPKLDDEFARQLGLENLAALKENITSRLSNDFSRFSDEYLRRELFDQLDAGHKISLAPETIDAEYGQLENEYKHARENKTLSEEEMAQSEEAGLAELRMIAERRVRLALILAKYGHKHKVAVTDDDVRQQVEQEAENYPGQQQQFVEFLRNNKQAMQQVHSRAHESAIVRKLIELASTEKKDISMENFQKLQQELGKKEIPAKTVKKKAKAATKATTAEKSTTKPAAKKAATKAATKATTAEKSTTKPAAKKTATKAATKTTTAEKSTTKPAAKKTATKATTKATTAEKSTTKPAAKKAATKATAKKTRK